MPMAPGEPIEADALVIGAGPVGLWQVFECGLLGLHCAVVDVLPAPGGQCHTLYADKPLYDIPGLPASTGQDLVDRLCRQIQPFAPSWHLGQQVVALQRRDDGRFALTTSEGTQLLGRCVFIAAGVGAFLPRRLPVEGLEPFEGRQVFHHEAPPTSAAGLHLVVAGGEDEALQRVADLCDAAEPPASLTLLHRRDRFDGADPALAARLAALRAAGRVQVLAGQPGGLEVHDGRLTALQVDTPEGGPIRLALDQLQVCLGLSPRLGPVADWGLAMARRQLAVDTARFETSEPGIHAVGDVVQYPGKRRLIVCGFHEATLAAFAAAERLRASPVLLEYTTSSKHLQQRLGVLPGVTNPS